jgi:hypothetical protein
MFFFLAGNRCQRFHIQYFFVLHTCLSLSITTKLINFVALPEEAQVGKHDCLPKACDMPYQSKEEHNLHNYSQ